MSETKLKRCPFCGGEAEIKKERVYAIQLAFCGLLIAYIIASMASASLLLGYAVYKILKRRKQMNGSEKNKECESCFYFGRASDAPETVEEECMYIPAEDDDYIPPCERKSKCQYYGNMTEN